MYTLKLNGTKHTVTTGPDGKKLYDPPLPSEKAKKWKRNIKDICESRTSPGLRTDTSFHAGRGTLLDQLDGDEVYAKYLVQKAKEQGYTPTDSHVYVGQLADTDGDPKAWFAPGEGLAEMKKRCEATGKGCEMPGLSVKPKPYTPKPAKAINPKIAASLAAHYRSTGEADGMTNKELNAFVTKKHGRNKSE